MDHLGHCGTPAGRPVSKGTGPSSFPHGAGSLEAPPFTMPVQERFTRAAKYSASSGAEGTRAMRRRMWWTLLLLGLPRLAAADGASPAAAPGTPDLQSGIESVETPAAHPPPGLDLHLDPAGVPPAQELPTVPHAIAPGTADRQVDVEPHAAERGLSFGVELRPRSQFGNRARQDAADAPGLRDDAERLMERSTIGVRGRYRF
jgi:hypothetical protein